MIDKIKAEMESGKIFLPIPYREGYFQAMNKCLKWAEELKEELKNILLRLHCETCQRLILEEIEKAFHGGEMSEDNSPHDSLRDSRGELKSSEGLSSADTSWNLSDIFEIRKFCGYCRAAPKFCKCKEPMYAVWLEAISADLKEFIRRLKDKMFTCGCCVTTQELHEDIDKLAGEKLV